VLISDYRVVAKHCVALRTVNGYTMYTLEALSKHVSISLLSTRSLHLLDTRNAFELKGVTLVVLERIELDVWTC
jgi:hypothetical protein